MKWTLGNKRAGSFILVVAALFAAGIASYRSTPRATLRSNSCTVSRRPFAVAHYPDYFTKGA